MGPRADTRPVIEAFWASLASFDPDGPFDPAPLRAGYDAFGETIPKPAGVGWERVELGGVPVERVGADGAAAQRTVLWVHGGGYVTGSPVTHRSFAGHLSLASDATVLVPDYRLAPEHRCPAALEDVLAAYRALLDAGADPAGLVVGGESSGGGVALAALAAIRDGGLPAPAAAVLVSPWADLTYVTGTREANRDTDPISSVEAFALLGELAVGDGDPADPRVSPLLGDLSGLPPLLVQVDRGEIVLDDARRAVEGARAGGGQAELDVTEGLFHNAQLYAALLAAGHDARAAVDRIAAFVRARTGG